MCLSLNPGPGSRSEGGVRNEKIFRSGLVGGGHWDTWIIGKCWVQRTLNENCAVFNIDFVLNH